MAISARDLETTISDYSYGLHNELIANRKLLKAIQAQGNMMFNCYGSGDDGAFSWVVQFKEPPLQTDDLLSPIQFTPKNYYKRANLSYIGYSLNDWIPEREQLINRSKSALVNHYERMLKQITLATKSRFSTELYINSAASGNSGRLSGIETMMPLQNTTDTVTITSGAARTGNVLDVVGYPSATYAGLSTVLGNESGSWGTQDGIHTTWPFGSGDLGYDYWSPVVVNYDSDALAGTTHTWAGQAVYATRFMIDAMNRYVSDAGGIKLILLNQGLFRSYKDQLDSKERANVTTSKSDWRFGFGDMLHQDGVDITSEFGVPTAVGYGFNIKQMTMRSCFDKLFRSQGPKYEWIQRGHGVNIDFLGQMQFESPRFFGKLALIVT